MEICAKLTGRVIVRCEVEIARVVGDQKVHQLWACSDDVRGAIENAVIDGGIDVGRSKRSLHTTVESTEFRQTICKA